MSNQCKPHQLLTPTNRLRLLTHASFQAPVVDFQWNPHDPWTFFSVADEAGEGGGGTLQVRPRPGPTASSS